MSFSTQDTLSIQSEQNIYSLVNQTAQIVFQEYKEKSNMLQIDNIIQIPNIQKSVQKICKILDNEICIPTQEDLEEVLGFYIKQNQHFLTEKAYYEFIYELLNNQDDLLDDQEYEKLLAKGGSRRKSRKSFIQKSFDHKLGDEKCSKIQLKHQVQKSKDLSEQMKEINIFIEQAKICNNLTSRKQCDKKYYKDCKIIYDQKNKIVTVHSGIEPKKSPRQIIKDKI